MHLSSTAPTLFPTVAIIGAGPAGLMAAEVLSRAGVAVDVFDAKPSAGRKFLLAGRGGLNLTHSEALDAFVGQLSGYRWLPVVADEQSACPQRGFVTGHLDDAMLNDGDVDIYLCGPPPMVNAVSGALRERGINPAGFWYEKFLASQSAAA